ncbi:MAG: hypothetical protein HYT69_00700 [Candidatus Zambryskibacteria bacterium]|nr:hypothetical protein [Candidatus Zambryskibacteria bacterium]
MVKIVSTGSTLSSPEFHRKKLRARRKRLFLWGTALIIVLATAVLLLRRDALRIAEVKVVGNEVVTSSNVTAVVKESLSGYYFGLIPKDSTLFYSSREIERELLRRFPRFNLAEISLEGLRTLEAVVAEREPLALYCPDLIYQIEDSDSRRSNCYFLDETGFIFDSAPTFSEGVYFIYYSEVPFESPLGREFVERDEFWELHGFLTTLHALGFEPISLKVGERDLILTDSSGARLLWRRDSNFDLIRSNLEVFLNAEEIRSQPDFLKKISELDLRTENKIFYKFK